MNDQENFKKPNRYKLKNMTTEELEDVLIQLITEKRGGKFFGWKFYSELLTQLHRRIITPQRRRPEITYTDYNQRKPAGEGLAESIFSTFGYEVHKKEKTGYRGPDFEIVKEDGVRELVHVMPLIQDIERKQGKVIINKGALKELQKWQNLIIIIETIYKDKLYATRIKDLRNLEGVYFIDKDFSPVTKYFPKINLEEIKHSYAND